jgi:ribonuclease HII
MPRDAQEFSLKDIQEKYSHPDAVVPAQLLRRLRRDSRAGARRLYQILLRRSEEQSNESRRLEAMLHFERVLWKAGITRIAGVDEVGIGPLAGPVVAAAVVFPPGTTIEGIHDSKLLDAPTRERLDGEIRHKASGIGIGIAEIEEIDRINVYHAGLRAMQLAVAALPAAPQHVLVDSRTIPDIQTPQNSFDKGDGINFSIAAASIVAKVYRDRLMTEMDSVYPGYGFAEHKGYATPVHQAAIRKLGPCPIHRKSFDYIRELCGLYSRTYYDLKDQGTKVSSRTALLAWEKRVRVARAQMSVMENKKIQIAVRRLWKRISD